MGRHEGNIIKQKSANRLVILLRPRNKIPKKGAMHAPQGIMYEAQHL
jgi:hypothetical protein